ncbi:MULTISPECIES: hypothetical protein [unclassified Pseudoalteromonas]|uniref:hypothetical protein n=1 Tax=unclassified Pseudoalteromonas TaxID=194690 RepID=UPI0025B5B51E|nr:MULTISPECIES: hypothetical protein [unclassified Pseudoalteromonas]MDN3380972.1 hypothetical protein [Pseudoalteromonas sp. APC 3893]MDN3389395.1 hypothetical protein [Pseudoalteromonas sp. APC 4017]
MAITYRPNDEVSKELERLKGRLNINTSTKLIDFLILEYQKTQTEISNLKADNYRLGNELDDKNDAIDDFKNAFNRLMD